MTRTLTLWFTGLPCIGKTTTARAVQADLSRHGIPVQRLDSDELAPWFTGMTGDTSRDRDILSRAMALAAFSLNRCGISCLCAATAPRRAIRDIHRQLIPGYVEIFCQGRVETARTRDGRRLYDMADTGFIEGFTGVDEPYEPPLNPDLVLDMETLSPEECAGSVMRFLDQSRFSGLFSDRHR